MERRKEYSQSLLVEEQKRMTQNANNAHTIDIKPNLLIVKNSTSMFILW